MNFEKFPQIIFMTTLLQERNHFLLRSCISAIFSIGSQTPLKRACHFCDFAMISPGSLMSSREKEHVLNLFIIVIFPALPRGSQTGGHEVCGWCPKNFEF